MSGKDLLDMAQNLESHIKAFRREAFHADLKRVEREVADIHASWSGSNLGYHADVYYEDFVRKPSGVHFSSEWGLQDTLHSQSTRGSWREYQHRFVKEMIRERAGNPDLSPAMEAANNLRKTAQDALSEAISLTNIFLLSTPDQYLQKKLEHLDSIKFYSPYDLLQSIAATGQVMTRDSLAAGQGFRAAPHQELLAEVQCVNSAEDIAGDISSNLTQIGSHMIRLEKIEKKLEMVGTNVFIGHGRDFAWRDLKDFIKDRLRIPYDEFNRVPVAGVTNIARLSEMMDAAAIAFIVLTSEDEMKDGTEQARMNVIHEVGLFQGRLGFSKAIVLLEEDCAEFSNIQGLGQIRFPRGKISASFEDIRRVLEREGLIEEV